MATLDDLDSWGDPTIPFICIKEGFGGVIDFNALPKQQTTVAGVDVFDVKHIGTTGCRSCVGIYFPLGDNKCFVAHINANKSIYRKSNGPFGPDTPELTDEEGKNLKALVLEKISREVGEPFLQTKPSLVHAREKMVLVCPDPREIDFTTGAALPGGPKHVGHYVAEAVCELLGVQQSEKLKLTQGFVVNHCSGKEFDYLADDFNLRAGEREYARLTDMPAVVDGSWRILRQSDGNWKAVPKADDTATS